MKRSPSLDGLRASSIAMVVLGHTAKSYHAYFAIAGIVLHVTQRPYRFLNNAPVVWLGRISYSLYLWQQPFCSDPALRCGWLVIFALICACLSYYFIEQPALRFRERLERPGTEGELSVNAKACPTAA